MGAVWIRARAELRGRWRSGLLLALLIGIAGGAVTASVAGARRTDSAYPRFLDWAGGPDTRLYPAWTGPLPDPKAVAALPEVSGAVVGRQLLFLPTNARGDFLRIGQGFGESAASQQRLIRLHGRAKIVQGRMLDPDRPDEIVVDYGTAGGTAGAAEGVHVGERVTLRFLKVGGDPTPFTGDDPSLIPDEALTAPFEATVVGITFTPTGFGGFAEATFSPAFLRQYGDRVASFPFIGVDLRHGDRDLPAFNRDLRRLAPGQTLVQFSNPALARTFRRNVAPQGVALRVFAILAAVAALLVFGQSLARRMFLGSTENPTLRSLGMTRAQLLGVAALLAAFIGVCAAAVCVTVAVAASPLFPIGPARVAEPNPGLSLDPLVLGAGGALTAIAVVLLAALPAWRAAAGRGDALGAREPAGQARPSAVANSLAGAGAPPSAVAGARMAFEAGRGRTAVPVRSAMLGTTIAIAAVVAALTFAASFQHLFETPRLYGWNWDAAAGSPYTDEDLTDTVLPALQGNALLVGLSGGNVFTAMTVEGANRATDVPAFGLDLIRGSVHPPMLSGRWPSATNEVALGSKTMRQVGVDVGDRVTLRAGDRTLENVRVVGRAVFLDVTGVAGMGEGVGLTFQDLRILRPNVPQNVFPVQFAPGVGAANLDREARQLFAGGVVEPTASDTGGLRALVPVKGFPLVLAALLAAAALATIGHTIVTSIGRRRRDLAILKTLGFVRRQVSATVAWQASALTAVALLVGVPLGIAAGRWAWTLFADTLGVVPEVAVPLGWVLLFVPATLLLVNAIALAPGRAAGRIRPATVLRTE